MTKNASVAVIRFDLLFDQSVYRGLLFSGPCSSRHEWPAVVGSSRHSS